MTYGDTLISKAVLGVTLALTLHGAAEAADKARVSGLSDANFGLIAGTAERSISQNVCAYTSSNSGRYSVSASGTGNAGAFALSSGSAELPYDVLWSDTANQAGGTTLLSGTSSGGFTSSVSQHFCNNTPPTATLTIVIRSAALGNARAGTYTGTLQITIAPE